jgi:hypothetical protein
MLTNVIEHKRNLVNMAGLQMYQPKSADRTFAEDKAHNQVLKIALTSMAAEASWLKIMLIPPT